MNIYLVMFLILLLVVLSFYFGYDFCKYCYKTYTVDTLNSIKLKFTECRYELYTNGQFHDKAIDNNGHMFAEGLREAERMVNDKIAEIRDWKR